MLRPASDDVAAIPPSLLEAALESKINFVHPGYGGKATLNIFLSLLRLDDGGVCFDTAITACGVIACNQWNGFLSTDKAGQERVVRPADGILRDHWYYFHVPAAGPLPYPIVPRFSDWDFPHDNLPPAWTGVRLERDPIMQSRCVATNYSHGVDSAHCIPSGESEWWDFNTMTLYASQSLRNFSTQHQDSHANRVPLRSDFHRVFDGRHLCFVPKEVKTPPDSVETQTRLYIYVFVPSYDGQVAGLWHNRALHNLPPGLSRECLFARFAYTVLSPAVFASEAFLKGSRVARHLWTRSPGADAGSAKMESPDDCRRISQTARSRSPRKRSAAPDNGDDAGGGSGGDSDSDGNYDSGYYDRKRTPPDITGLPFHYLDDGADWEEEERGRTRKRTRMLR